MTLMTVLHGLILQRGVHLYFLGPYPFNLTRRTRRAEQGAPYLCGFPTYDWRRVRRISLITRRRYPTTDYPLRRVCTEHRRVPDTEPDDYKPLTYAGYPGYRRVRRVCEKV
jgi:hypothetical protein